MNTKKGTFDTPRSQRITLAQLLSMFNDLGVSTLYVKSLAANDNSKNQVYLASHLTQLSQFPTGVVKGSNSTSEKQIKAGRGVIFTSQFPIVWVDADSKKYPASNAKLIYYPQYPEVRFSGFLRGSNVDAGDWMDPYRSGRALGRWLLIGVGKDREVFAYLVTPESVVANELLGHRDTQGDELLHAVSTSQVKATVSNRERLICKLREIHESGWIPGEKLDKDGTCKPYRARNGGGYTLESRLGVRPNGIAEPDYLGYEVKQFGVSAFPLKGAKPTTLMTPEPDGGKYVTEGFEAFVRRYGYADKSGKPDRLNFGGRHVLGKPVANTGLTLSIMGYDDASNKMTDANGLIALIDDARQIAASWSFPKLVEHWKTKHALAVYIPCCRRENEDGSYSYQYGKNIEIGTGTDFIHLLSGMVNQLVYYDPGMKLENVSSSRPVSKRRSQFRINHKHLGVLYQMHEFIDITTAE